MDLVKVRGDKIVENWINVEGVSKIQYAADFLTAVKMVSAGRADYCIGSNVYISNVKNDTSLGNIKISEKPIITTPLFIVLSDKHRVLEPTISAALKTMFESGRTAEIFGL